MSSHESLRSTWSPPPYIPLQYPLYTAHHMVVQMWAGACRGCTNQSPVCNSCHVLLQWETELYCMRWSFQLEEAAQSGSYRSTPALLCVAGDLTGARAGIHTHTHGARAHIHASCLWQLSKDIGTHTGRQTGSRDAGWSGASAEVAGSWSSAGSTGDICRKSEIQTITEEMRKWLEVMFFLPTGCVPSAALYYVFYCTDVLS